LDQNAEVFNLYDKIGSLTIYFFHLAYDIGYLLIRISGVLEL